MKTSVIVEKPLFTLQSYNDHGEEVTIDLFADDFRSAEIGKKWEAYTNSSRSAESLEVVYKTASGVAVRYQNFSTDWEEREDDPELIWIELHFIDEAIQKPPRRRQQENDENTTKENENE